MNGGYCLSTYQTGDVLCACQDGYTGMRCFVLFVFCFVLFFKLAAKSLEMTFLKMNSFICRFS